MFSLHMSLLLWFLSGKAWRGAGLASRQPLVFFCCPGSPPYSSCGMGETGKESSFHSQESSSSQQFPYYLVKLVTPNFIFRHLSQFTCIPQSYTHYLRSCPVDFPRFHGASNAIEVDNYKSKILQFISNILHVRLTQASGGI